MSVYSFTANHKAVYHNSNTSIIIQIQKQSLLGWSGSLSSLSWTSSVVDAHVCVFGAPLIESGGDNDAGEVLSTTFSLEAINRPFEAGGTRVSDILSYNPYEETIHVRVGYSRNPLTESYTWNCGTIAYPSINYSIGNLTANDSWVISFDVNDTLSTLTNKSTSAWMNESFKHVDYDVSASNVYLSYFQPSFYSAIGQGKVKLEAMMVYDEDNNTTWLGMEDANDFRFIRIVDLFKAVSESLGLEAQVNQGAAWNTVVSTRWFWNDDDFTGSDSLTLFEGSIEHLYVMSGWFYAGEYHNNNWTLFDYANLTKSSLLQYGSVLEALKFVLISLGLQMSVKMTSSGQRYLEVTEKGKSYSALTGSVNSGLVKKGIEMNPYPESVDGILVRTAFDTEITLGDISNNYINLDTLFVAGQNVIRKNLNPPAQAGRETDKGYGWYVTSTTPWSVYADRGDKQLHQTLWISMDTPAYHASSTPGSASAITDIHTVCAISPRRNFVAIPDTAIGNAGFFYMGGYQTTIGANTINGMLFPSDVAYKTLGDHDAIHAFWLASYYYSIVGYNADPVGLQRKFTREIEIEYPDILNLIIGQDIVLSIGGNDTMWRIKGRKTDLATFTTTLQLTSIDYSL